MKIQHMNAAELRNAIRVFKESIAAGKAYDKKFAAKKYAYGDYKHDRAALRIAENRLAEMSASPIRMAYIQPATNQ